LVQENGDKYDFSFNLCINWEFINFVLSWQENVEVLEPVGFRKKVIEILEASVKNYLQPL